MRKLLKIFMIVGLGAVLSLPSFPFNHVLTDDRGTSGGPDSLFGIFFSVSSAQAGGNCLNYKTEKKNYVTEWCRNTGCSSECSSQAACITQCKLGCNRFAEKLPSGPWPVGACHVDEDQLSATTNGCYASCETDYPGTVSNVSYCQRGCYSYSWGLLVDRLGL
jgi:hypothetical protein